MSFALVLVGALAGATTTHAFTPSSHITRKLAGHVIELGEVKSVLERSAATMDKGGAEVCATVATATTRTTSSSARATFVANRTRRRQHLNPGYQRQAVDHHRRTKDDR